MKNINLLTEKYTKRIIFCQNIIRMTAIVAVVFLLWGLIVGVLVISNKIIITVKESNSYILADDKYRDSDRIAKELQAKGEDISQSADVQRIISGGNMSLYYWVAISEEIGSIKVEYLKIDSPEKKITIRFRSGTKLEAVGFVRRLENRGLFSKIDLVDMNAAQQQNIFVLELYADGELK